MGGMFNGCCGNSEESSPPRNKKEENIKTNHEESYNRSVKKNRKNNNKHSKETKQFDDINKIQQQPGSETPSLDPKIKLMEPKTLKLLSDIGEIKKCHEHIIDNKQMAKDMKQHAAILAQLENPTAFQK